MKLPYLEMHIVDHCNLNCELCSHFSNLAPKRFIELEWFHKQLVRLLEVVGSIERLALLGGEPTLHPQLLDFVHLSRKYLPGAHIEIATNGILLGRMGSDFWEALSRNGVALRITYYPKMPPGADRKAVARLAAEYGVSCRVQDVGKNKDWFYLLNTKGDSDPIVAFANCPSKFCHTLYEGRFYLCPRPAYIHFWNMVHTEPIQVTWSDYVEIFRDDARRAMERYLGKISRSEPLEFCRWCPERRQSAKWVSAAVRRHSTSVSRKVLGWLQRG